jgi:putative acetyltransferase
MTRFIIDHGFAERDRDQIVALLREYEAGIGVSLCFQGFEAEVAGLPGDYAPPRGAMLMAREREEERLVGMVALRPLREAPDLCEMKRLYVQPAARGSGLGRELAIAALEVARRLGYRRICLDTLPGMLEAQALYCSLGFRQAGTSATRPQLLLFERALASP